MNNFLKIAPWITILIYLGVMLTLISAKSKEVLCEKIIVNINGFKFYSPSDDAFFWATGNGNLPCVNKKQVNYIKQSFGYVPQLRSKELKNGFKSLCLWFIMKS